MSDLQYLSFNVKMGWTISWEEFVSYTADFMTVSEEICDGWVWQGDKERSGSAYIVKKIQLQMPADTYDCKQETNENCDDLSVVEFEESHSVAVAESADLECTWEYHVLYSISYATPVLYFNAFYRDGRLLPLEVIWKRHGTETEALQHMRWEALSQQEHPILRRPFYQLHPCKTAEFLSHHLGSSLNPVVTWLSSIGRTVGLHLDNEYSKLVNKNV
ncbi:hypothetical protein FOCC_FOCC000854 [Frankliniella occidentalis]|nr:hypothetical protein FOCC_FOCC000854 [Frankliniella occidentalis]